jgi:hypothetical protein
MLLRSSGASAVPLRAALQMTVLAAAALLAAASAPPPALAAAAKCPDMIVSASDLDEILNQTLGSYRDLVDQHKVVIDPANSACYVRFTLGSTALPQLGGSACNLGGCSTVLGRQQSVALREFDVTGCDGVFDLLGLSRHVPSHYVDASARIRQHCGSADFEISDVSVVQVGGEPKIRFGFRPAATTPAPVPTGK